MNHKIHNTDNYSSFKRIVGNRTINKAQVKKLRDSFNDNPELASAVPIVVNDQMEIVDGQHRFMALKSLGLPIWYYVAKGFKLPQVQRINSSTKNWSPFDYAKSYSELGNQNYKTYLDFKARYNFTHHVLLAVLTGSTTRTEGGATTGQFRKGDFKVANIEESTEFAKKLIDVLQYFKSGEQRVFVVAFKKISASPNYDHGRMMSKLAVCGSKILKETQAVDDYMRMLEKIYNFHKGTEGRVRLF